LQAVLNTTTNSRILK